MSRHPELKWAQRVDKVYLTVLLPDTKDAKVNLEPEGVFTFSASAGAGDLLYELKLNLFDKVDVEESKINVGVRSVFCILEKAEKGWWKRLLLEDGKAPHFIKVDWDKWVDEDEDNGNNDLDMGGMDFSKLGGMGGMGGMGGDAMGGMDFSKLGGMGGMGGDAMGGMDFSKFGGMGGMGGMGDGAMGGMDFSKFGGMGGMGGMGDDFEDSDDEDQEASKPDQKTEGAADKTQGGASEEKKEASAST